MDIGVLWDMDGTLIDSEPLHERTLRLSLAREGIAPPDDLHDLVVGRSATWIHAFFAEHYGLTATFADWSRFRCSHYVERSAELQPRQGALELFRELQQLGIRQAIVSNSDRVLVDANLRALGLLEPDLVTISRNDVHNGKPDAEPYLRAAWLLRLDAARLTVVEDSPTGARAGLAAGIRTIFWPQAPSAPPEGAMTSGSATQLRSMILRLRSDSAGNARAC